MIARLLIALGLLATLPAHADEGHDHGGAPATAHPEAPSRQPDGSVFLPKPAQRQLGLRTQAGELEMLARSVELSGRVTMDPNAGGKVQPTTAGRIEPGPRGLPSVGQAVRKGEVLAYVRPSSAPLESAGSRAQLAELQAARALAAKRVARLRELADTVPAKDLEAAESEQAGLDARAAAIGAGLGGREALVAPVAGVVASAHVVAGQVVDARELAYEVVDPTRLAVEALAYDAALAADVGGAVLAVGTTRVPLRFVGAARSLREQALPLSFRAEGAALSALAVGQPVTVVVQTRTTLQGIAVPAASVLRNAANQSIVWVKTAPERFEPRVVGVAPLDGLRVAVTSGLVAGERVATQGASLLNQIR
jgi:hypothetical protein